MSYNINKRNRPPRHRIHGIYSHPYPRISIPSPRLFKTVLPRLYLRCHPFCLLIFPTVSFPPNLFPHLFLIFNFDGVNVSVDSVASSTLHSMRDSPIPRMAKESHCSNWRDFVLRKVCFGTANQYCSDTTTTTSRSSGKCTRTGKFARAGAWPRTSLLEK